MITLGIIGVISALTLPMLIAKYQKVVALNQLKKSYAQVNELLKMAEAQYGPISEWSEWSVDKRWYQKDTKKVVREYLAPLVKGEAYDNYDDGATNYFNKFMCFKPGVSPVNYAVKQGNTETQYLHMNNAFLGLLRNSNPYSMKLVDGSCIGFDGADGDYFIVNVYIDINGDKKPNIAGKDLFRFQFAKDTKLVPVGFNLSDNELKNVCTSGSFGTSDQCAAKIIRDGWQIKNDYPW